jgi:hypothetical protein
MTSQKLVSSTASWGSLKDSPTMASGSAKLLEVWRSLAMAGGLLMDAGAKK